MCHFLKMLGRNTKRFFLPDVVLIPSLGRTQPTGLTWQRGRRSSGDPEDLSEVLTDVYIRNSDVTSAITVKGMLGERE